MSALRTRILPFVVALGLLVAAAPARADTKTQVSDAQRRLSALEAQIKGNQARASALHDSLVSLAAQVRRSRALLAAITDQVEQSNAGIARMETRYATFREQMRAAITNAYITGPVSVLATMLDARSVSDAGDTLDYAGFIVSRDAQIAARARVLSNQLRARKTSQARLMRQRAGVVADLSAKQNEMSNAFNEQLDRLDQLANARAELASLLNSLRKKLRAEELAAALAALGGTPLSFGNWAEAWLDSINAPVERNNLIVMVAWQTAEYTNARWNPLATTMPMPGSTRYNSSGVRNYVSLKQGLEATLKTLRRGGHGYGPVLSGLAHDADPMDTAKAINASDWCRGCADGGYVVDLIPVVAKNYERYSRKRA